MDTVGKPKKQAPYEPIQRLNTGDLWYIELRGGELLCDKDGHVFGFAASSDAQAYIDSHLGGK